MTSGNFYRNSVSKICAAEEKESKYHNKDELVYESSNKYMDNVAAQHRKPG